MLGAVAAALLYGKRTMTAAQAQQQRRSMVLALDGVDEIVFTYKGRLAKILPDEIVGLGKDDG